LEQSLVKKLFGGEIEFPANPFVALADFLIILLLVMILAVVHQSLGANKVIERTAVSTLQDQLLKKCWSPDDQSCQSLALRQAHARGEFDETYRDGDLQRFRFKHTLFFKWLQPDCYQTGTQTVKPVCCNPGKQSRRSQSVENTSV
jgi:hypothetical protein